MGRDAERHRIGAWLTNHAPCTSVLVLTGPAGIGKTALWEWLAASASEAVHPSNAARGTVLMSRASRVEARLPWVCLTDLLSGVPVEAFDALPGPQHQAPRVVTLQETTGEPLDDRLVGTALWTLFGTLGPLLIAVDDLPYADAASAAALGFALRRLQGGPAIRLAGTVRAGEPDGPTLDALDSGRIERLEVGPVPISVTSAILTARGETPLPRPVLARVHETSGGNPLYAIELARALERAEITILPGVPLPVPARLDTLIGEHVRSQPPDVLAVVAAAAAAWRFTEYGVDGVAVSRAVAGGLVKVVEGDWPRVVRVAHPLIGAAAYASLPAGERQALHERLAQTCGDPVERARHLTLAGTFPPATVARALDDAVRAALAAGTPDIAVDLSRMVVGLSATADVRAERTEHLAVASSRAGDAAGAVRAGRGAVDLTPAGPLRALRKVRLVEMMWAHTGDEGLTEILDGALDDAAGEPRATVEVLCTLAAVCLETRLAASYADRALTLLDGLDDAEPRFLADVLNQAAAARFRAGLGLDHRGFGRAIELERGQPRRQLSDSAAAAYASLLKFADEPADAEVRLLFIMDEAQRAGDLESVAFCLGHLPQIALWQGRLGESLDLAGRHLRLADDAGMGGHGSTARYNLGVALAHLGGSAKRQSCSPPNSSPARPPTGSGSATTAPSASPPFPPATPPPRPRTSTAGTICCAPCTCANPVTAASTSTTSRPWSPPAAPTTPRPSSTTWIYRYARRVAAPPQRSPRPAVRCCRRPAAI